MKKFLVFSVTILILAGCGDKGENDPQVFKTVQEAKTYNNENLIYSPENIYVDDPSGKRTSLYDIEEKEKAEAKKQREAKTRPTVSSSGGEVLKYEDTTMKKPIVEIFKNTNPNEVKNGGTPSKITLQKNTFVSDLHTYHWNNAKWKAAGTVEIRDASGKSYGIWKGTGEGGQDGVIDASWKIEPAILLKAGTYIIVDSDPASWSQNEITGGEWMVWASGYFTE